MNTSHLSIKFRSIRSSTTWCIVLLFKLMMVIAVANATPRKEGTTMRKVERPSAFSIVSFQLPSLQKKRRSKKEVATLGVAFERSLNSGEEDTGTTIFPFFTKGKNGVRSKKIFVPNATQGRVSSSSSFSRLQSAVYPTAAFLSENNDKNGLTSSNSNKLRIMTGLTKVSNMASLLCVVDCTVLPIITVILPLLGLVSMSPAQSQWLHELGHRVALGFVMPVGGLASITNFWNHRNFKFSSLSMMGLCLIYAANAGHHAPLISMLPHHWAHALHCGTWLHRITNILGCALLLSSNYFSHRAAALQGNNCCGPNGICANNEDDDVEIFFDRQRV